FVILADGVEDPHNLGALIRTAEAAGAHGIIIPKRHSAGLTATAAKAAAGAVFHLPIVRVSNLVSTMEELKEEGVWFYCADMDGQSWCKVDYKGGVGLVIGSEGSGVSRLIKEKCDFVVSLPMCGEINSLNASVAGSILMYEVTRQRLGLAAKNN
ncbi:MAG: 23S rRNA (guanosine(2251)-2'-O)-methyltransferase RlmB, partial [Angelakisella sp.]